MRHWLRVWLLSSAIIGSALAAPADLNGLAAEEPIQTTGLRRDTVWRPLQRLQNVIIEKIWRIPPERRAWSSHQTRLWGASTPSNLRAQFGGDVVLRFQFNNEEDANALSAAADVLFLDIWEASGEWVDIRIAKDVVPSFLGLLPKSLQQSYSPVMHDLAQAVYESYPSHTSERPPYSLHSRPVLHQNHDQTEGRELFFHEYQPLSVIHPWMRLLASLFPSHVTLITIGQSYEGRDISALRIGVKPDAMPDDKPRQSIVITGGSHAREWISTSTVNYIAYSLITRYGKFPGVTSMLESYDFIFVPTINPDGYAFTWEKDRLWRKNRQETSLWFCKGVDLDRSFGFEWDGANTSDNPCSESYAGTQPFGGVEAKVLADWAKNETANDHVELIGFLDFHSYSQQILYPYSYTCESTPPSLEALEEVAYGLAKGFRTANGHRYSVSSACEGSVQLGKPDSKKTAAMKPKMTMGGGSALDWFYHEIRVKYAYQIKLRDTGSYGFLLPKQHIVPTGQEAFNAVVNLGQYLLGNNDLATDVEWENEFIVNIEANDGEGAQTVPAVAGSEEEDKYVEDEENDYNVDLRRRRRR